MKKPVIALVSALLAASIADGQEKVAINGVWSVSFPMPAKRNTAAATDRQAKVTFNDGRGIWLDFPNGGQRRDNPCLGKETPVTIVELTDRSLVFQVNYSQVLQGCKDVKFRLTVKGASELEGTTAHGAVVTMLRQ